MDLYNSCEEHSVSGRQPLLEAEMANQTREKPTLHLSLLLPKVSVEQTSQNITYTLIVSELRSHYFSIQNGGVLTSTQALKLGVKVSMGKNYGNTRSKIKFLIFIPISSIHEKEANFLQP